MELSRSAATESCIARSRSSGTSGAAHTSRKANEQPSRTAACPEAKPATTPGQTDSSRWPMPRMAVKSA